MGRKLTNKLDITSIIQPNIWSPDNNGAPQFLQHNKSINRSDFTRPANNRESFCPQTRVSSSEPKLPWQSGTLSAVGNPYLVSLMWFFIDFQFWTWYSNITRWDRHASWFLSPGVTNPNHWKANKKFTEKCQSISTMICILQINNWPILICILQTNNWLNGTTEAVSNK